MACKTFAKKIDTDQIRQETASLAENIAAQAERAAVWAAPRVSKARTEVAKAAKEAQLRAQPVVEEARTRVVEDYVPAAHRAAVAAQNAADTEGTLTERAQRIAVAAKNAALEIPEVPVKKKHPVLKTLGWLALAGAAAGAAYVVWRRSQPVEDPWAEEYWADAAEDEAVGEGISAPVVPAE
ncbi:hypothetical protein [Actinomyces massiliensis]|nr:hypothetical protein [Actinomyces massiliensis]